MFRLTQWPFAIIYTFLGGFYFKRLNLLDSVTEKAGYVGTSTAGSTLLPLKYLMLNLRQTCLKLKFMLATPTVIIKQWVSWVPPLRGSYRSKWTQPPCRPQALNKEQKQQHRGHKMMSLTLKPQELPVSHDLGVFRASILQFVIQS